MKKMHKRSEEYIKQFDKDFKEYAERDFCSGYEQAVKDIVEYLQSEPFDYGCEHGISGTEWSEYIKNHLNEQ